MSLRVTSKYGVPKYFLGGLMTSFNALSNVDKAAKIGQVANGISSGINSGNTTNDKIGKGVESAVGMFGPVGTAVSTISKFAGKAFGQDQNGQYKNKVSELLNNSLNISNGVSKGLTNIKDLFKGDLTKDAILDQFSLGLLGKSKAESEGEKMMKFMDMKKTNNAISTNELASNQARIPAATAPLYGRKGGKMGIKTKYC